MCKERIWNQGKAVVEVVNEVANCAKSGFGIKAKQIAENHTGVINCAKSGFGIKAKLRSSGRSR